MIIVKSSSFKKGYKRLSNQNKNLVDESLRLFSTNPFDTSLENHSLSGKLKKLFSIKAGYDLRIIYEKKKGFTLIILISVGKHNDVY